MLRRQSSKRSDKDDFRTFSTTYQADYNWEVPNPPVGGPDIRAITGPRAFVSPSYRNLTHDTYLSNRLGDSYPNNYRTSTTNPLCRYASAPFRQRTQLDGFYLNRTAPVAKPDQVAIYEADALHGWVHDHFVSQQTLKTHTQSMRDIIVGT